MQPLDVPPPWQPRVDSIRHFPSVALFAERGKAVQPSFTIDASNAQTVAALCARLDGLPLAIEIAAARIRTLEPRDMLDQIEALPEWLQTSAVDRPGRHRSLRAAVNWSYDLLSDPEKALVRRLGVFAGGATLDAIQSVCFEAEQDSTRALPLLGDLVEKSLVVAGGRHARGPVRYTQLETVRLWALEKLHETGELEWLRQRHANYFLNLVAAAALDLWKPNQVERLDQLESELANLRLVLERTTQASAGVEDVQIGLQVAALPWTFWDIRGHHREARVSLERLLAHPSASRPNANRAAALDTLGWLAYGQGDFQTARRCMEDAFALWTRLGQSHGLAWSAARRGMLLFNQGELEGAAELFSMVRQFGQAASDRELLSWAAYGQAHTIWARGDVASAESLLSRTLTEFRESIGPGGTAFVLFSLGMLALQSGDTARADALLRECLQLRWRTRDLRTLPETLESLAGVSTSTSDHRRAAVLLGTAQRTRELTGAALLPWLAEGRQATFQLVRGELGEALFDRLHLDGCRMQLQDAVEYALLSASVPPRDRQNLDATLTLSQRERQVAKLLARGLSNREIATRLVISERTAEAHVEHIRSKLGVSSRGQVGLWAIQHGLVDVNLPQATISMP